MTSKNLFFKLMKEDLKRRLWAIALVSLGFFFFYPVVTAVLAGEIKQYVDYAKGLKEYTRTVTNWLSVECGMTVFMMMVTSLICGLSSFSYLNSKSKVDFYHGIPVRREKLYVANFLNGILILAVPYGICLAVAVMIAISNGVNAGGLCLVAAMAYVFHLTYYVLMYTVVVLASLMTGNLVVGFLGTMVLTFYVPIATALIMAYYEVFFLTFYDGVGISHPLWEAGVNFSPVMEYIRQVSCYMEGTFTLAAVLKAWAFSVVLTALGCFLYKKRPSEAAGKAMAFSVSRPIIRILMTILSSIGLGLFFWGIRSTMGWAIFGILCGGTICHCVMEIIYSFDFKKLFSCKLQLAGCLLAALAILTVFRYDLFGYDRYLPKESQVKEAVIYLGRLDDWVSYGSTQQREAGEEYGYYWQRQSADEYVFEHMHYPDAENVISLAEECVRQTQERRKAVDAHRIHRWEATSPIFEEKPNDYWFGSRVNICYTLNSGKKVCRSYYIDFYDRMRPQVQRMYGDAQFQKGVYPLMNRTADQVEAVRYRGEYGREVCLNRLSEDEKKEILETYQQEFSSTTIEEMEQEAPISLIRFTSQIDEKAIENEWKNEGEFDEVKISHSPGYEGESIVYEYTYDSYSRYNDFKSVDFYPVYPSFTKTLAWLKAHGIEQKGYLDNLIVSGIRIEPKEKERYYNYYYDSYESEEQEEEPMQYTTSDPGEIASLRKILASESLCYYDSFFQEDEVDAWMFMPVIEEENEEGITVSRDGEGPQYWNISVEFPKGKVPPRVWEKLGKQ